jgi:hypothetical protein
MVGMAKMVDGSEATGAGEVGGGVEVVAKGVEGAEERGRDARRQTL